MGNKQDVSQKLRFPNYKNNIHQITISIVIKKNTNNIHDTRNLFNIFFASNLRRIILLLSIVSFL
jgi:hypothetical protein